MHILSKVNKITVLCKVSHFHSGMCNLTEQCVITNVLQHQKFNEAVLHLCLLCVQTQCSSCDPHTWCSKGLRSSE
jgi:hypothetical protein